MTKTLAQLTNAAIRNLGIVPLTTESYAYVTSYIDPTLDDLKGRNIVDVTTTGIAERHFTYVADILAYKIAPEFDKQVKTDPQLLAAKVPIAEEALKMMQKGKVSV